MQFASTKRIEQKTTQAKDSQDAQTSASSSTLHVRKPEEGNLGRELEVLTERSNEEYSPQIRRIKLGQTPSNRLSHYPSSPQKLSI